MLKCPIPCRAGRNVWNDFIGHFKRGHRDTQSHLATTFGRSDRQQWHLEDRQGTFSVWISSPNLRCHSRNKDRGMVGFADETYQPRSARYYHPLAPYGTVFEYTSFLCAVEQQCVWKPELKLHVISWLIQTHILSFWSFIDVCACINILYIRHSQLKSNRAKTQLNLHLSQ